MVRLTEERRKDGWEGGRNVARTLQLRVPAAAEDVEGNVDCDADCDSDYALSSSIFGDWFYNYLILSWQQPKQHCHCALSSLLCVLRAFLCASAFSSSVCTALRYPMLHVRVGVGSRGWRPLSSSTFSYFFNGYLLVDY